MMATIPEGRENVRAVSSLPWCAATWRSTRPSWRTRVKASDLRPATEEEIRAVGAVPGYASPVGLKRRPGGGGRRRSPTSPNLVAGANEEGYHLLQRQLRA